MLKVKNCSIILGLQFQSSVLVHQLANEFD